MTCWLQNNIFFNELKYCKSEQILVFQTNLLSIWIRILNADPNLGSKFNKDPIESRSETLGKRSFFKFYFGRALELGPIISLCPFLVLPASSDRFGWLGGNLCV